MPQGKFICSNWQNIYIFSLQNIVLTAIVYVFCILTFLIYYGKKKINHTYFWCKYHHRLDLSHFFFFGFVCDKAHKCVQHKYVNRSLRCFAIHACSSIKFACLLLIFKFILHWWFWVFLLFMN